MDLALREVVPSRRRLELVAMLAEEGRIDVARSPLCQL